GEYLLGGATSSSFPCSGQPYWVPVRKLRGPSQPRLMLPSGDPCRKHLSHSVGRHRRTTAVVDHPRLDHASDDPTGGSERQALGGWPARPLHASA
ncbi:hypothetical protein ACH4PR_52940, partial [Streptomyces mirabilis]